jgi:muramidase (phage lysozyme)
MTIDGETSTTEVGPTGSGTVGISTQPGAPGTDIAGQSGTSNGGGTVAPLPPADVVTSQLPADTTTPSFASLFLQALQFIPPAEAATPGSTAAQQQARVATAQGYFGNPKVQAFLTLIETAEGATYRSRYGDHVNGTRRPFDSYATYPAATPSNTPQGRYQVILSTYNFESARLGLTDFSPQTQDIMAVDMLVQNHAIGSVVAGDLAGG